MNLVAPTTCRVATVLDATYITEFFSIVVTRYTMRLPSQYYLSHGSLKSGSGIDQRAWGWKKVAWLKEVFLVEKIRLMGDPIACDDLSSLSRALAFTQSNFNY